jgi:UDP-glucose 4-epimerase
MKDVLVTGSSGYIGQHLVKLLQRNGYRVFGIDNTPRTNDYLLPKYFMQHDIRNNWKPWMNTLFEWPESFDTIVHLAALVRVNESVEMPYDYYNNNINGTYNVLENFSCHNFVFASTGVASNPTNPYALSKRVCEDIVKEHCVKNNKPYTMFRFYNVTGSEGTKPTNPDGLLYNLIKAKETGEFNLYGTDYNTSDGTPVRDYVHVMEICDAIKTAIETPANGLENLGHGVGYSVKEIAELFMHVNKCDFKINNLPRREGDLESSVLDNPSTYMKSLYKIQHLLEIK